MKHFILNITYLVIALISFQVTAQDPEVKGYRIDGEDVVFTFNRDDYNQISHDNFGKHLPFEDLDIKNVVVSGQFNNWSKEDWLMNKVDKDTYELRKKINYFTDEFSWEFKFVINNKYWAEPNNEAANVASATKDGTNLNVYNLKLFSGAYPDKNGNVRFRLRGYDDAKKVIIAGTFNKWNEHLFKLYKIKNGWEIVLQLRPDEYQYKFIVDGEWMEDPTNLDKVENEHGSYNSRIDVKKRVEFKLNGFENAKKVILTGTFNDWNADDCEMEKDENGKWTYSVPLSGGKYHYKFIVDDKWIIDPINKVQEYDDKGNINSVCMVK